MQMTHSPFAAAHLRRSLKRGLAGEAIATAQRHQPEMARIIALCEDFRPNPKGLQRLAQRLQAQRGVVRVALIRDGLTLVTRSVREVQAQREGEALFTETGLIHHRLTLRLRDRVTYAIQAVSFCRHALERLVERSDLPLGPLLPQVDAEAVHLFRQWDRGGLIEGGAPALTPGLWAGGLDEMALEGDWGLASRAMSHQVFSARTFLAEAQMSPTLWLRWRDDPFCRVA